MREFAKSAKLCFSRVSLKPLTSVEVWGLRRV